MVPESQLHSSSALLTLTFDHIIRFFFLVRVFRALLVLEADQFEGLSLREGALEFVEVFGDVEQELVSVVVKEGEAENQHETLQETSQVTEDFTVLRVAPPIGLVEDTSPDRKLREVVRRGRIFLEIESPLFFPIENGEILGYNLWEVVPVYVCMDL